VVALLFQDQRQQLEQAKEISIKSISNKRSALNSNVLKCMSIYELT